VGFGAFVIFSAFFSFFGERWLRGLVFEAGRSSSGKVLHQTRKLNGLYILGELSGRISIISGEEENSLFLDSERAKLERMSSFYLKKSELSLLTVNICFLCLPYYLIILIPFVGENFFLKIYLFLATPLVRFLKGPIGTQSAKKLLKMTKELNIESDFSSIINKVIILKENQPESAIKFFVSPLSLGSLLSHFSYGE